MSAPMAGRRPSRFTFNIPSPTQKKQSSKQQQLKYSHHPPPPSSFLALKHDTTASSTCTTNKGRRRPVSTPHPITIFKQPAAFIDYSLSLQFSPSFSPSSCLISGLSPTSSTESPMSDMRQRRWSVEMLRKNCEDDSERQEAEDEDERMIMSPDVLSSSSGSLFSPFTDSSSLDTPMSSSPASIQLPVERRRLTKVPPAPILSPHRRLHSDPLPIPSTSSVSAVAFKLRLRPLAIPASKDEPIILLSALSPLPISHLTDRQHSCEELSAVDELLYGQPMTLSECWYGRSEMMSPVTGAGMMHMAAQQNKSQQMPFSSFCTTAALR